MKDQFQRNISYMRISITDRCNLRCRYCMPEEGVNWIPHDSILTFEEIIRVIKISVGLGFRRFRITGGEPLVRRGVIDFLHHVSRVPGVEDLMITTNGVLLAAMASDLKAAGVQRVNVSLDTLDAEKFKNITRGGDVNKVLQGVFRSLEVGLSPVKINAVVTRSTNFTELPRFAELAKEYPLHVRFIELMPIGVGSDLGKEFVPIAEMLDMLSLPADKHVEDVSGSGPAEYCRPEGYKGSIGFISAVSRHFCNTCNRVRLTSDGKLRPCLHNPLETDLRSLLRSGADDDKIAEVFAATVWHKPAKHNMNTQSWQDKRIMSQIGG